MIAGDVLHFAWVVPGAAPALFFGSVLALRLRRHPQLVKGQLALATAVYLAGAAHGSGAGPGGTAQDTANPRWNGAGHR